MEEIRYNKEHIWARLDDEDLITIGVSEFAEQELGEILSVSLPEEGTELVKDEIFGSLKSSTSAMDLCAPVSGEIMDVNTELEESPEIINEDPYDKGWIAVIEIENDSEIDDLMDAADYGKYVEEESKWN